MLRDFDKPRDTRVIKISYLLNGLGSINNKITEQAILLVKKYKRF